MSVTNMTTDSMVCVMLDALTSPAVLAARRFVVGMTDGESRPSTY
jgi:hypothetical protein